MRGFRRRLIIVYNPRSSHFGVVEREVLAPARKLQGWSVGKYEVKATDVDDNAAALAEILQDGDTVVAAGGDGTGTIGLNGVILSGKKVKFTALPFGNFNDLARTLGKTRLKAGHFLDFLEEGKTRKFYPLEVLINGRHWRYVGCYFTVGMLAASTALFDEPAVRKKLQTGKKRMIFSVIELARWYFRRRKERFVPKGTDLVAVNGRSMAKIMRGGQGCWGDGFTVAERDLKGFWRLIWFMLRSMLVRVPGEDVTEVVWENLGDVMVQAEGEYQQLTGVRKIQVRKAKGVEVIV